MARPKKTESAKTTVTEATTKKVTAAAPKATRVRKTVSVSLQYGGIDRKSTRLNSSHRT